MSRFHAYINNASRIVRAFDGTTPLAVYLKDFFFAQKKFGSTDRKIISALCYQYYRLGHWLPNRPLEEKLLLADYICQPVISQVIRNLKPEWQVFQSPDPIEKIGALGLTLDFYAHTPWLPLLQQETAPEAFVIGQFHQPCLFLRVRPGKETTLKRKLTAMEIQAEWIGPATIRLPNGTSIENRLELNREVVVQDLGSQLCGEVIRETIPALQGHIWDACAASGGKSLLLTDLYPGKLKLVVSDIRNSILHNLAKRFRQGGVTNYEMLQADLVEGVPGKLNGRLFDAIMVDAPCTGSGTWARTPEQHFFFKPEVLEKYSGRQLAICRNLIGNIKPGGYLIYITCSVFEKENGGVVGSLLQENDLYRIKQEIIDGTATRSDSMFIAILQKG